jgi:thiamine-phosphate pyrophosphorylase
MPAKEEVMEVPKLHCIVDASNSLTRLPALAEAGVDAFQVRAKSLTDSQLVTFTAQVIAMVRHLGALVIVNDRLDIALACDADGVHLGRDDLPIDDARRLAPDLMIGATVRDRAQAEQAMVYGADYAGIGPIFATASKGGLPSPLGIAAIGPATGALPLIAIGGIDAAGAAAAREAGAHGVAVIGAIWDAIDPIEAARRLTVGELTT